MCYFAILRARAVGCRFPLYSVELNYPDFTALFPVASPSRSRHRSDGATSLSCRSKISQQSYRSDSAGTSHLEALLTA